MPIERSGGVEIGGRMVGDPTPSNSQLPAQYRDQYTNDFDRDIFTAAIKDKGYDVLWESAAFCPNRERGGFGPKDHPINCTICDGGAWIYFNPTPTRFLITGVTMQQNFYAQGSWSRGRVMVTGQPEQRLHPFDRITLIDAVARFSEIIFRSPGTNMDRAKYPPVCAEYVTWVNRSGQLQQFREDVDFTITSDGYIRWANDINRPDDNTYYSAAYLYHPRYVVLELTHQYRESTVKGKPYEFPVAAMAQLDFLVRDESADAPQNTFADPFKIK